MNTLPSKGRCHAVFLLAHSARLSQFYSAGAWISNAKERLTFMASAYDMQGAAHALFAMNLVRLDPTILLHPHLEQLSFEANRSTLLAIASLLLKSAPPDWLSYCVVNDEFFPDLVPTRDLSQLQWLDDDLELVIKGAFYQLYSSSNDLLLKQLGDAGEFAVVSALSKAGYQPQHVALISDSYGYDISCEIGSIKSQIEVKACVPTTQGTFYLSRNEFDTACRQPDIWKLVQVTFSSSIFVSKNVTTCDIVQIRELPASAILTLAPQSSTRFRWCDTAKFKPKPESWSELSLRPADQFLFKLTT